MGKQVGYIYCETAQLPLFHLVDLRYLNENARNSIGLFFPKIKTETVDERLHMLKLIHVFSKMNFYGIRALLRSWLYYPLDLLDPEREFKLSVPLNRLQPVLQSLFLGNLELFIFCVHPSLLNKRDWDMLIAYSFDRLRMWLYFSCSRKSLSNLELLMHGFVPIILRLSK
jgi:hypothetical protein